MPIKSTKKLISYFFKHEKIGESMRYLFVGGTCAVLDLLFLYLMVNFLNIWYLIATTISFTIVGFLGYFGQKYFTFRNTERNHRKQLTLFFMVAGIGLLINAGFMFVFVSILGIWYIFANIITKFIVLIWNFFAIKNFVLRKS